MSLSIYFCENRREVIIGRSIYFFNPYMRGVLFSFNPYIIGDLSNEEELFCCGVNLAVFSQRAALLCPEQNPAGKAAGPGNLYRSLAGGVYSPG